VEIGCAPIFVRFGLTGAVGGEAARKGASIRLVAIGRPMRELVSSP